VESTPARTEASRSAFDKNLQRGTGQRVDQSSAFSLLPMAQRTSAPSGRMSVLSVKLTRAIPGNLLIILG
jgi:hypothetical protein